MYAPFRLYTQELPFPSPPLLVPWEKGCVVMAVVTILIMEQVPRDQLEVMVMEDGRGEAAPVRSIYPGIYSGMDSGRSQDQDFPVTDQQFCFVVGPMDHRTVPFLLFSNRGGSYGFWPLLVGP